MYWDVVKQVRNFLYRLSELESSIGYEKEIITYELTTEIKNSIEKWRKEIKEKFDKWFINQANIAVLEKAKADIK